MRFFSSVYKKMTSKIFTNSLWMMSEKLIAIIGLIFVTSFVAQYIGPENFGKLTFAASIFAIVQTIAMFGSDNIFFQKTSKNRVTGERLILATRPVRDFLYLICSTCLLFFLYFYTDRLTFVFSVASCVAIYFALHDVYSIYFNAILQSKVNALCNVIALFVSLIIRYIVVKFQLAIEWLSLPIILVTMIPFLMRKMIFNKNKVNKNKILDKKMNLYRRYMLGVGKKLVLYTLSVAIFTKTSQLFLGIKSSYDLGVYTVAVTLGTSFYFVLTALISSFMTQIYIEKDFDQSQNMVAKLNAIVILISLCALIFFTIFGKWIVTFLYGSAYYEVNNILLLMVMVCLFSGLSTVAEKYLIKFNAYDYLQKKTNILIIFNLIITFFSVHFYGLYGAVFAILVTEIISTTLFNYFFKSGLIFDTHKKMIQISTYLKNQKL